MIKVKGTGMSINWILAQSTQTVPINIYTGTVHSLICKFRPAFKINHTKVSNNVVFDRLLVHASATTPDMVHTVVAWLESTS